MRIVLEHAGSVIVPGNYSKRETKMAKEFDPQAENEKFNIQKSAQNDKIRDAPPQNPKQVKRTNEPNAGGQNREAGDRKARQNDRATNGGE